MQKIKFAIAFFVGIVYNVITTIGALPQIIFICKEKNIMKKILTFLLVASMLIAMFVVPSAAEGIVNAEVTVESTKTAPKIDGKVGKTEYGLPVRTFEDAKDEFTANDDHDEYDNWGFDFYMTWDGDNLYMAWVVRSEVHKAMPKATFGSNYDIISDVWPDDGSMFGHMWWHSCIQFIITPGPPKKGETSYGSAQNFLEIGLCQMEDGDIGRMAWYYPSGITKEDVSINDWNAAIERDDAAKTTTYEVAIPWDMTTVNASGDSAQFGLTFAVAAQENYGTKKGMIEWCDGLLGTKQPDNAAIITLKSDDYEKEDHNKLVEGKLPDEAKDALKIAFNKMNDVMGAESTLLVTELEGKNLGSDYGLNYSSVILCKPVEDNVYEVVEAVTGTGEIALATEIEDGMILVAAHTDGSEGAGGLVNSATIKQIGVGSKVVLFGVDLKEGKFEYTNSQIYVKELVEAGTENPGDVSGEESSEVIDESSEAVSEEESSEAVSETESKADTSAATSTDASTGDKADEEGGLGVWLWVIIGVAVVAVAAVVVIVLKKKKA